MLFEDLLGLGARVVRETEEVFRGRAAGPGARQAVTRAEGLGQTTTALIICGRGRSNTLIL